MADMSSQSIARLHIGFCSDDVDGGADFDQSRLLVMFMKFNRSKTSLENPRGPKQNPRDLSPGSESKVQEAQTSPKRLHEPLFGSSSSLSLRLQTKPVRGRYEYAVRRVLAQEWLKFETIQNQPRSKQSCFFDNVLQQEYPTAGDLAT